MNKIEEKIYLSIVKEKLTKLITLTNVTEVERKIKSKFIVHISISTLFGLLFGLGIISFLFGASFADIGDITLIKIDKPIANFVISALVLSLLGFLASVFLSLWYSKDLKKINSKVERINILIEEIKNNPFNEVINLNKINVNNILKGDVFLNELSQLNIESKTLFNTFDKKMEELQ
ncbi:hypothetical protein ACUZ9N_01480 [Mycoplasmopsis gallinarum]